ncbi:hypothetical protein L5876_14680, partial [Hyphobacterium sp. SN044]|uniref:hypothetical protein n=1 Tax=Hyphobacterium sp. SN044 TaxID=2912575 RepID=UPI001F33F43B
AMAQDVQVRVKVSHDVAREIQEAVESAVGADIGREIAEAIRSVTVGLPGLGHADAAFLQNREFRSEQTQRETKKLQVGAAGTLELKNVSGDIV